jgi:hypothetical protein
MDVVLARIGRLFRGCHRTILCSGGKNPPTRRGRKDLRLPFDEPRISAVSATVPPRSRSPDITGWNDACV